MSPQPIFGTASFGMDGTDFQSDSDISSLLELLRGAGVKRLDSGARYPPLNPGRSEELIGNSSQITSGLLVDTKVLTDTKTDGSGDLTAEAIEKSVSASLKRLQRPQGVNVLHIHRADPSTPVADQVRAFNAQIKAGHCKAWGVSNVPIPMLKEIFRICEAENWQKPVCYQGEFNIITRGAETELLPLLRKHNVTFNAFRPLASGFLSGNFTQGDHGGTRFSDDNPLGKLMQNTFKADDLQEAMAKFLDAIKRHDISSVEVALRWIFHHSILREEDGVVLGASKTKQVVQNLELIRKGALPTEIVDLAESLWTTVKETRSRIY